MIGIQLRKPKASGYTASEKIRNQVLVHEDMPKKQNTQKEIHKSGMHHSCLFFLCVLEPAPAPAPLDLSRLEPSLAVGAAGRFVVPLGITRIDWRGMVGGDPNRATAAS